MPRKRIQRKNPWEPTPAPDILQTRGFSNGKKARQSKLPTTSDILQTRPFSPRNKDVSTPKDTRSFEEKMQGAEFRYNGVSIQAFAHSESPAVQREEDVEENSQEQREVGTSAGNISVFAPSTPPPENPILSPFSLLQTDGLGEQETIQREEVSVGEEEKEGFEVGIQKQQLEAPPDDGTIQRLCDECGAEKEEEKLPETIQAQVEISETKDYTQNTFESIRGDKETYIWQPKSIGKLDAKILARNQQSELSITKAKPSRIRAKKVSELVGNTETLPAAEIASPTSEVAATTETKELHQPIQAKHQAPQEMGTEQFDSASDAKQQDQKTRWDKFIKEITLLLQPQRQAALKKVRAEGQWESMLNALSDNQIALVQGWLNEDVGDGANKTLEERIREAKNSAQSLGALAIIDNSATTQDPMKRITPRIRELLALGVALPKLETEDLSQEGVLSIAQVERAVQALLWMPNKEYLRLSALLELSGDNSRLTQSFLMLEAVAARADQFSPAQTGAKPSGDLTALEQFADDIRDMNQQTLVDQTSVSMTSSTDSTVLTQKFTDSCGVTAAELVRAEADPVEALGLNKNNELGQDALNTDTAREQEKVLENYNGPTAVPRGRATIITAISNALPSSGCTPEQKDAVLNYLNGIELSQQDQLDFAIGITKLENTMGSSFPGADPLRMVRESAAGPSRFAGLRPGTLVNQANTTLDVDGKTGRPWQNMPDDQLFQLYLQAGKQVTEVNMAAWSARVKVLLDRAEPLVEQGYDISFSVFWHEWGGHAMVFTDVRKEGGREFLVYDPWTGTTQWVTEVDILAGKWPEGRIGLLCGLQG